MAVSKGMRTGLSSTTWPPICEGERTSHGGHVHVWETDGVEVLDYRCGVLQECLSPPCGVGWAAATVR